MEWVFSPTPEEQQDCDMVSVGICQLERRMNWNCWELAEPLSIRVVLEILQSKGIFAPDIILDNALKMIFNALQQFRTNCSEKEKFAEFLTVTQLLQSNGKSLGELEVLKANIINEMIPKWMFDIMFQITKTGTARQLGNFTDDLEVIEAIKSGKLENVFLLPEKSMRPDGLWLHFQGGLWYAVVLGQKINSNIFLKQDTVATFEDCNRSTNLRLVYYQIDGSEINVKDKHEIFHRLTDEAFRNDPSKLGGILRIHLLLPSVVSSCSTELKVDGKQVWLYITKENVSSLFPDDITLEALSLATRKKLLRMGADKYQYVPYNRNYDS